MTTTNHMFISYERQLSIVKEIKDLTLEAEALHGLGGNHRRRMGDNDKAIWSTWNSGWYLYLKQEISLVCVLLFGVHILLIRPHFDKTNAEKEEDISYGWVL